MQKIKILPAKTTFQWDGDSESNEVNLTVAAIVKNDGTKFYFDLTDADIEEIMFFLKIPGSGGHINLYHWLKDYKKKGFDEHIGDTDEEHIVVNMLKELKDYFKIDV